MTQPKPPAAHQPRPTEPPASQEQRGQGEPPAEEKVLCPHCRRTASNGIKCQGICVADSDY